MLVRKVKKCFKTISPDQCTVVTIFAIILGNYLMMISLSRVYRYKKELQAVGSTPEKPLFTEEFKSYQDPGISIRPFSTKPPAPPSQNYVLDTNSFSELNPFMDTWRKATFSKNNLTIYLYSAFYDNRDPNNVLIRINVAAPTKFRGVSYLIVRI